ncbi:MAG: XRE family transcriptional regulator [Gallionella sp.]|nr:XRE family transcriptional regulator [Gallionella sp.]
MSETSRLITTIKRLLKSQGLTYRDVAQKLKLSEPSVKRLFASESFTVNRLVQVSQMLGYTLAEVSKEAESAQVKLATLTEKQERELVSDYKMLIVAVCALNHLTMKEIMATYRFSSAECLKYLLRLDKLRIIDFLPGNRIRINVSKDFDWLPQGPIKMYFQTRGQSDFLESRFTDDEETMAFVHGMLTEQALAQLQEELRRLRQRFAMLHEESLAAPLARRRGIGLLLAMRSWEPVDFVKLRR